MNIQRLTHSVLQFSYLCLDIITHSAPLHGMTWRRSHTSTSACTYVACSLKPRLCFLGCFLVYRFHLLTDRSFRELDYAEPGLKGLCMLHSFIYRKIYTPFCLFFFNPSSRPPPGRKVLHPDRFDVQRNVASFDCFNQRDKTVWAACCARQLKQYQL